MAMTCIAIDNISTREVGFLIFVSPLFMPAGLYRRHHDFSPHRRMRNKKLADCCRWRIDAGKVVVRGDAYQQ